MATSGGPGRQLLADQMYDVLFGQFMDGTRVAGEPLNIGALSRELNVSQTPLREALARLEHTGLVRREALKGYHVAPLFEEGELVKLMEARLVIEPALAYEAARRTTPEFLEELLGTVEELQRISQSPGSESFRAYWAIDEKFHSLISRQSDNSFLATAYSSLGGQVQRFRLFAELGTFSAEQAAKEHREIYSALAAGEHELAADRMRQHVENSKARSLGDRRSIVAKGA